MGFLFWFGIKDAHSGLLEKKLTLASVLLSQVKKSCLMIRSGQRASCSPAPKPSKALCYSSPNKLRAVRESRTRSPAALPSTARPRLHQAESQLTAAKERTEPKPKEPLHEWRFSSRVDPLAPTAASGNSDEEKLQRTPPMNNAGIHLLTEDICPVSRTHARMHPAL